MEQDKNRIELSKSSKFNRKAMRVMNIAAITLFILAIIYKVFFSK